MHIRDNRQMVAGGRIGAEDVFRDKMIACKNIVDSVLGKQRVMGHETYIFG